MSLVDRKPVIKAANQDARTLQIFLAMLDEELEIAEKHPGQDIFLEKRDGDEIVLCAEDGTEYEIDTSEIPADTLRVVLDAAQSSRTEDEFYHSEKQQQPGSPKLENEKTESKSDLENQVLENRKKIDKLEKSHQAQKHELFELKKDLARQLEEIRKLLQDNRRLLGTQSDGNDDRKNSVDDEFEYSNSQKRSKFPNKDYDKHYEPVPKRSRVYPKEQESTREFLRKAVHIKGFRPPTTFKKFPPSKFAPSKFLPSKFASSKFVPSKFQQSKFAKYPPKEVQYRPPKPTDLCYKCGNRGHQSVECDRDGPMCYRCRRYEGHIGANCPYSDEEVEEMKRTKDDTPKSRHDGDDDD